MDDGVNDEALLSTAKARNQLVATWFTIFLISLLMAVASGSVSQPLIVVLSLACAPGALFAGLAALKRESTISSTLLVFIITAAIALAGIVYLVAYAH